jgi:hypothetical protein
MDEISLQTIFVEIRQLRKTLRTTCEELRISAKIFLTVLEVALLIGWKEKSLRNRTRKKLSSKALRNGRRVLFREADVETIWPLWTMPHDQADDSCSDLVILWPI